jgi:hypothetical protein
MGTRSTKVNVLTPAQRPPWRVHQVMGLMTPVSPLSQPWASLLLVLWLDWDFEGEGNFWESSSHVHQSIILLGTILRTQMRLALGCEGSD